jgi:hypothetical protein
MYGTTSLIEFRCLRLELFCSKNMIQNCAQISLHFSFKIQWKTRLWRQGNNILFTNAALIFRITISCRSFHWNIEPQRCGFCTTLLQNVMIKKCKWSASCGRTDCGQPIQKSERYIQGILTGSHDLVGGQNCFYVYLKSKSTLTYVENPYSDYLDLKTAIRAKWVTYAILRFLGPYKNYTCHISIIRRIAEQPRDHSEAHC